MFFNEAYENKCQEMFDKEMPHGIKNLTGDECVEYLRTIIFHIATFVPSGTPFLLIAREEMEDFSSIRLLRRILRKYAPGFLIPIPEFNGVQIDLIGIRAAIGIDGYKIPIKSLTEACLIENEELRSIYANAAEKYNLKDGVSMHYDVQWKAIADHINSQK